MSSSLLLPSAFLALLLLLSSSTNGGVRAEEELLVSSSTNGGDREEEETAVLTLDAGNFSEVVAAHQFIVVDFYAPWCYFSRKLAPEYEKAASILRHLDPPIVLAKIDADDKQNADISRKYGVLGYPTIRILRNRGTTTTEESYYGERDAESMVQYLMKKQMAVPSPDLKKQVAPLSPETKLAGDAASSATADYKGRATALLYMRIDDERYRDLKDQTAEAWFQARKSGKNIGFEIVAISGTRGDSQLEYFKLKRSDLPLILIQAPTANYMKPHVEPDQIKPWFKEFMDGTLEPYYPKSDSLPEVIDRSANIDVANSHHQDVFFNSALLELRQRVEWACHLLETTIVEIFGKHGWVSTTRLCA